MLWLCAGHPISNQCLSVSQIMTIGDFGTQHILHA